MTDGVIHDMKETKNSIVRASKMGISVIIIGLGPEDFASMEELDGDRK